MLINPTKKSMPLFSALPQVADKAIAKQQAQADQFFSWHANYFTADRKKYVLLVNDLTYTPILLNNMNAQAKKTLDISFISGIRMAFAIAGIKPEAVTAYLTQAGALQINAAFDRVTIGVLNEYLFQLSLFSEREPLKSDRVLQPEYLAYLSKIYINRLSKPKLYNSRGALKAAVAEFMAHK
ncbi:DUF6933 domain-containing protein [Loigolactobacillus coryniformis subsp. coryniformis]|uniref:DUF6933 domain-containing protein n=1 Tax=Loigolactobacillus coryniformis subsp. torquens DSM 20004 = KCTC 3535 TaxID=1423822 RepID=A0A2D1KS80_9LACO|nr:hypothetical protein [Loigolactobacillus coryniformis]ATO44964.1 hypothetical protein LC20004_00385 [Loigolactobacillus coryniformis subsp. torquens DSM 20004 = KCTC 3535]